MLALALRGFRFHWRSHGGVFVGATLATAILVGALAVGDSVRQSLRAMALARLGSIQLALNGQSRFLRSKLADDLAKELHAPVAPGILVNGTASIQRENGEARSGHVQVVGVTDSFWPIASSEPGAPGLKGDVVAVNESLARKLNLRAGDDLLLRVEKPSLLSRDAPLSTVSDSSVPIRLPVGAIVADRQGGRFSLEANQLPPLTEFVPLERLQRAVGMEGRANVLLVGSSQTPIKSDAATRALWKHWDFADAGLTLKPAAHGTRVELSTERIFLDPPIADVAVRSIPHSEGVLTYFVNELRVGGRTTPYSTVAAMAGGPVPPGLRDDETLINQWLAEDLQAKAGDRLKLTYWVVSPMRKLVTQSSVFRIRAILPLSGGAADPDLMPRIPGLSDKKNCRDWQPGVPIDLHKIRERDQDYWTHFRGTPKAFITLSAGQRIWNNRFGNLTAVRYPAGPSGIVPVATCIRQYLSPASLGIYFAPARDQALAASSNALDFGGLFLGFSFFLVAAALLLTGLLFGFAVEQRSEEIGTLLAIGFRPGWVRRLLLLESAVPMLLAAITGSLLGTLYTQAIVRALNTVWQGAVAGASLVYAVEPVTLMEGAVAGLLTGLFSIWLVVRLQARARVRDLLAGSAAFQKATGNSRLRMTSWLPGVPTALVTLLFASGLLVYARRQDQQEAAETFFMAGALLLVAGLAAARVLLAVTARRASDARLTIGSLGVRGSARRVGRSLAAVALLASGTFLVIAVGASREDASAGAQRRGSGTGGFLLYGETSLPVYQDLNRPDGLDAYSLDPDTLRGVSFVQMRLRRGDEASCLNLNRAQTPNLLGVQPEVLRRRKAFTFAKLWDERLSSDPWSCLQAPLPDGSIPAVGDTNTVIWSLGKGLGDVVSYVDEQGNARKLKIVGILSNSILQGGLLISETDFTRLFPSAGGYQVFLIDAPRSSLAAVGKELSRGLEDQGLDLTSSVERLAAFNTVEATYLSIFAALGGLGLLLGSAGLGVIVLRNVLERRGELALLRAVGFRQRALHQLIFSEHVWLLLLGIAVGAFAAVAAILPTVRAGTAPFPAIAAVVVGVCASGLLWTWLATRAALKGPLISALRNE